jgi:hypothetical protein
LLETTIGVVQGPGDTGLIFAGGSHRDFAMLFWHDDFTKMDLVERGYRVASAGTWCFGGFNPPAVAHRRQLDESLFTKISFIPFMSFSCKIIGTSFCPEALIGKQSCSVESTESLSAKDILMIVGAVNNVYQGFISWCMNCNIRRQQWD